MVVDGRDNWTASTQTTLVDNAAWFICPTTLPADDYFNGGTIWFKIMGTAADEQQDGYYLRLCQLDRNVHVILLLLR